MGSYESFAGFYDELTGNVDYEKRGAYFHRLMLEQGKDFGILVDLACGTGSLSEFFARLNYDVIGVDASEDMLAVAQEKRMQSGGDIVYLNQQMQELDLFGTVDIVLCALDSLNHLTNPQDVRKVFERISLFLNEGGLFIFDVNTVYKHENVLANNTFVYDCDDVYCVWQNALKEDHLVEITLDMFEYDAEEDCYYREQESFGERAYEQELLRSYLEEAGFKLLHLYADDTQEDPGDTAQRLVFVAANKLCRNGLPQEELGQNENSVK